MALSHGGQQLHPVEVHVIEQLLDQDQPVAPTVAIEFWLQLSQHHVPT